MAGLVRESEAAEVISPAYDLFSSNERGEHARRHPRSFLNGTPSEGDDPDLDYQGRRLRATEYLEAELTAGTWDFRPPSYYVLEIVSRGHSQVGVVGDVGWDCFPDAVRPHEVTRPERVSDLVDYLETVRYGSSPVGLAYLRKPAIDDVLGRITSRPPALDVTLADGDRHRVWRAGQDEELLAALEQVDHSYIIDGHHRVAATVARGHSPETPAGKFLVAAFPADELSVYPFHRWVETRTDDIGAQPGPLTPRPGEVVAVTRAGEWTVSLGTAPSEADATALARGLLAELGIEDERTDPRLRYVPGYPDDSAIRHQVASSGGVGLILAPCPIETVMSMSDLGEFMPPKATFFAPKPRSGVFLVRR